MGETSASAFETGAIASVSKFLAVPIYDSLGVPANIALARIEGLNSTQEKIQESEIVFEAVKSTLKCLGGIVAKRLLDMIVDQTTDWIQNGGEPQFVTNWEDFVSDAANEAGGEIAQAIGLGFLCSNFDLNVRLTLTNYTFLKEATCTIDDIVGNVESFYKNFLDGGWIAYNEIWLPANNYYGTALMAFQAQSAAAARKAEAAVNEAIAGQGYLSAKKVIRGVTGTEFRKTADVNDQAALGLGTDEENPTAIIEDEEITTPGTTIGSLQNRALESDFNILENVISEDAFTAYANAIADAALNRLIKEGVDGIRGLSTPNKPAGNFFARGDICNQLEGDAKKACLSLNDYDSLSPKNQKEKLRNDIDSEKNDLKNIIGVGTSSIALLQQQSSTLNSLLNCQLAYVSDPLNSASNTQIKINSAKNSLLSTVSIIDKSNFLISELNTIGNQLQTSAFTSVELTSILTKFNKYKDNRLDLLALINTEAMNRQKNTFELNNRQANFDLDQCRLRNSTSTTPT